MVKGRGKGKISNELVAAGCAAVLAVYAAGFLRTREAARRFETEAKERRPSARGQLQALNQPPAAIEMKGAKATSVVKAPAADTPGDFAASAPPVRQTAHNPGPENSTSSQSRTLVRHQPVASVPTSPMTASTQVSSSNAPREIAPVPLPTEELSRPAPIAIAREPNSLSAAKWRDGTFTGLGDSPHGDIEARVVIKDGRIIEAGIATCDTRYPCSVIDPLIHQPVYRQSPNIDYMSRATESSDAYYYALVAALESAQQGASSEAIVPK